MTARMVRLYVFLAAIACACGAGVQRWLMRADPSLPGPWLAQFAILLAVTSCFSALLFLFGSSARAVTTLLFLRFIPLAVIGIPEGAHVGIILSLGVGYVIEIVHYARAPFNRVLAFAAISASAGLLSPVRAWGLVLPRPALPDLIALWLCAGLVAVVADRYKAWAEKSTSQDGQIRRLDEAILQLTSANMGFQRYADTIQEQSAAEERNRITREIHDTVGYTLINIMMMMEEASLLTKETPDARRLLDQARDQAQSGLNETRRALRLLRATERRPVQTIAEIKKLVTAFQSSTGVEVSVEYGNIPFSLSEGVNDFVFHMLQEGMANALRHGKATRIRILFWQTGRELIVNLHDNGVGSEQIHEGIGLSGMRERIAALGGSLAAGNEPDGFQITARLPCPVSEGSS